MAGTVVPLIERIPPVQQRVYRMGSEHLGVVVGDTFDAFVDSHTFLTGMRAWRVPPRVGTRMSRLMTDIRGGEPSGGEASR